MAKKSFSRMFVRYSLYNVLPEIVLIKPIICIPMSTSRFTQKCDCFQSHAKISGKMLTLYFAMS